MKIKLFLSAGKVNLTNSTFRFQLVANFEDNDYQVKVSAGEGGKLAVSSTFNNNDIVQLNASHTNITNLLDGKEVTL